MIRSLIALLPSSPRVRRAHRWSRSTLVLKYHLKILLVPLHQ